MKRVAVALFIGLLFTTILTGYSQDLKSDLADGIVRLHIVANSNSEEDQNVKIKIRDKMLEKMQDFENREEIQNNLHVFEEIADEVLKEEGFDYKACAEYGVFDFPTKHYANFSLPRGKYEAVKINLGSGSGENWWCVLFPPLCMVDVATEEGESLLKDTFGDNYSVVTQKNIPVKIKFKIAEWF